MGDVGRKKVGDSNIRQEPMSFTWLSRKLYASDCQFNEKKKKRA